MFFGRVGASETRRHSDTFDGFPMPRLVSRRAARLGSAQPGSLNRLISRSQSRFSANSHEQNLSRRLGAKKKRTCFYTKNRKYRG